MCVRGSGTQVAAAGAVVVGVTFGMARYAYGLTMPQVTKDLGLSPGAAGTIAGAAFAGYLATLLVVSWLSRRFGPRAPTLLGGGCVAGGGLVAAAAPSAGVLTVGVIVAGAASALVWAPFSDLVVRAASPERRPTLLAVVTTGTAAGLVVVGLVALVVLPASWRWVWVAIAGLAVLATLLELALVPRGLPLVDGAPEGAAGPARGLPWVRLLGPIGFAAVYFGGTIVYFSYATEAVRSQGLAGQTGPLLFVVLGVTGLAGLSAGRVATRLGPARLGGLCLLGVAAGLLLLAFASGSLTLILLSAAVYGPGFMAGSALTAIWTAAAAPERAGDAFTVALFAGAVSSVLWPAAVGAGVPTFGLGPLLAAVAVLLGVAGSVFVLFPRWLRRTVLSLTSTS